MRHPGPKNRCVWEAYSFSDFNNWNQRELCVLKRFEIYAENGSPGFHVSIMSHEVLTEAKMSFGYRCWLVAKSCLTLCDLMDCSPPGSSVCGILQEYWSGLLFPSLGASSWPRDRTCVSCLAGRFFTTEPPGKPPSDARTPFLHLFLCALEFTLSMKKYSISSHFTMMDELNLFVWLMVLQIKIVSVV